MSMWKWQSLLCQGMHLCSGVTTGRMGCLQISSGEEHWRVDVQGHLSWADISSKDNDLADSLYLVRESGLKLILAGLLQISSGEEGWRVDGGVNSSWMDDGSKGVDFAGNLELVDFATLHLCKLSFGTLTLS